MRDYESTWSLASVVKYLHQIYPEVGPDCPYFAIQVVLFAAAVLQITDVDVLTGFTGCPRSFVYAIAQNMRRNNLWVGGKYPCGHWLTNGQIANDKHFCEDTEIGEGNLFDLVPEDESGEDPYGFWGEPKCSVLFEVLFLEEMYKGNEGEVQPCSAID